MVTTAVETLYEDRLRSRLWRMHRTGYRVRNMRVYWRPDVRPVGKERAAESILALMDTRVAGRAC